MSFHSAFNADSAHQLIPIVRLWILRILVPLGTHPALVQSHGFFDESLAEAIGLGCWVEPSVFDRPACLPPFSDPDPSDGGPRAFVWKHVMDDLRRLHRHAEMQAPNSRLPLELHHNLSRMADLVGLCDVDRQILAFAIMLHTEPLLADIANRMGKLTIARLFQVLALLLNLSVESVANALSGRNILGRSGLITLKRLDSSPLTSQLALLFEGFASRMRAGDIDPVDLLRGIVAEAPASHLKLADYAHLQPALNVIIPYLRYALETQRCGVNVLLYGEPGTGKTQLASLLAETLACKLYEVAYEDDEGDPVAGESRLRAYSAAQSFFAQRRVMVLFDEMEDVCQDGERAQKNSLQRRKAWINRMMEQNRVPCLWLSNSVQGLDPAMIRRFDLIYELPIPPRSQRLQILRTTCGDLIDLDSLACIAESQTLAPAVVTRAGAVIRAIQDELGVQGVAPAFEALTSNTLKAQGHAPLLAGAQDGLLAACDLRFLQTDADLMAITQGLRCAGTASLCLYGPPGSGKTAYARWLATQLDRPLLIRRASDYLSSWVGGSERNIASAFQQAQQEAGVLVLEEVDSLLAQRHPTLRSWELSLINEVLAQMDSYTGVLIATTNRLDTLDQAALRRFDFKIKFDFLQPDQAWQLLCRDCGAFGLSQPSPQLQARLQRLQCLTPGDFSIVRRQHRIRPLAHAEQWLTALESECALKLGPNRAIGFV